VIHFSEDVYTKECLRLVIGIHCNSAARRIGILLQKFLFSTDMCFTRTADPQQTSKQTVTLVLESSKRS